jgi:hypothetical protein
MKINLRSSSAFLATFAFLLVSSTTNGLAAPNDIKNPIIRTVNPSIIQSVSESYIPDGTIYGEVEISTDAPSRTEGYKCKNASVFLVSTEQVPTPNQGDINLGPKPLFSYEAKLTSGSNRYTSTTNIGNIPGKCYYRITAPKKDIGKSAILGFGGISATGGGSCYHKASSLNVSQKPVELNLQAPLKCTIIN